MLTGPCYPCPGFNGPPPPVIALFFIAAVYTVWYNLTHVTYTQQDFMGVGAWFVFSALWLIGFSLKHRKAAKAREISAPYALMA